MVTVGDAPGAFEKQANVVCVRLIQGSEARSCLAAEKAGQGICMYLLKETLREAFCIHPLAAGLATSSVAASAMPGKMLDMCLPEACKD